MATKQSRRVFGQSTSDANCATPVKCRNTIVLEYQVNRLNKKEAFVLVPSEETASQRARETQGASFW